MIMWNMVSKYQVLEAHNASSFSVVVVQVGETAGYSMLHK
jgi:hypothetical protein